MSSETLSISYHEPKKHDKKSHECLSQLNLTFSSR